ncbi:unnamed protein product [Brachionus calyciflorus]|uniref:Uncharacterized protein n=1 Tax=Brachionus calyciflorus TaxID=104777 RepID=A0A814PFX5_9BILA|nr:unnamed protein product [Brachionus calyciflorus]
MNCVELKIPFWFLVLENQDLDLQLRSPQIMKRFNLHNFSKKKLLGSSAFGGKYQLKKVILELSCDFHEVK